jgi:trehalose/maltose hydrolase-like predicted phosphorylase
VQLIRYATDASGFEVCIASRVATTGGGREPSVIRRVLAVFTSRDTPDPRAVALAHVEKFGPGAFDTLLEEHELRWRQFWEDADIGVGGDPATEQALRFAPITCASPWVMTPVFRSRGAL